MNKIIAVLLIASLCFLFICIGITLIIFAFSGTEIGEAVSNYILSKIVKEKTKGKGTNIPKPTKYPMPPVLPPKEVLEEYEVENNERHK